MQVFELLALRADGQIERNVLFLDLLGTSLIIEGARRLAGSGICDCESLERDLGQAMVRTGSNRESIQRLPPHFERLRIVAHCLVYVGNLIHHHRRIRMARSEVLLPH